MLNPVGPGFLLCVVENCVIGKPSMVFRISITGKSTKVFPVSITGKSTLAFLISVTGKPTVPLLIGPVSTREQRGSTSVCSEVQQRLSPPPESQSHAWPQLSPEKQVFAHDVTRGQRCGEATARQHPPGWGEDGHPQQVRCLTTFTARWSSPLPTEEQNPEVALVAGS